MSEEKVDLQKLLVFQREFALKEFSDAANVVLDRGAKFNVNDMNYLASRLKKGKKTYLNAHKKGDKKGDRKGERKGDRKDDNSSREKGNTNKTDVKSNSTEKASRSASRVDSRPILTASDSGRS